MNVEDEFLDPEKNPLIAQISAPDPPKPGEESDGLAPFELAEPLAVSIARKLNATYPGSNEILIGNRTLVKMADNSYQDKKSGRAISELTVDEIMEIDTALG